MSRFHIRRRAKKNQAVLEIIFAVILGISFLHYISYQSTLSQTQTLFKTTFEKKSWAQLDIYQRSNREMVASFFDTNLNQIDKLSKNPQLSTALRAGNISEAQIVLDQQREMVSGLTSLYILDQKGVMVAASGKSGVIKSFIGKDFSEREYFKAVIDQKGVYVSKVFKDGAGNNSVTFNAPVMNGTSVLYDVVGGINLVTLSDTLKISSTTTDFAKLESAVTDSNGTLLVSSEHPLPDDLAIAKNDRLIQGALVNGTLSREDETNYRGVRVFGEVQSWNLPGGNRIVVASYFPKEQFDQEITRLRISLDNTYFGLGVRNAVLILLLFLIIAHIIKRHDQRLI